MADKPTPKVEPEPIPDTFENIMKAALQPTKDWKDKRGENPK